MRPSLGLAAAANDPQWNDRRWNWATWDSGSPHYEYNGIDDDGDTLVDEGTNSLDDDGDGVVDEEDEREMQRPYPQPIRGLQVRFKAVEKTTASVRQLTITHSFVPE